MEKKLKEIKGSKLTIKKIESEQIDDFGIVRRRYIKEEAKGPINLGSVRNPVGNIVSFEWHIPERYGIRISKDL